MNLNEITRKFLDVEYYTGQFSGLIHIMLNSKIVNFVFSSGRIICTEAKNGQSVYKLKNNLHSFLEEKNQMVYE